MVGTMIMYVGLWPAFFAWHFLHEKLYSTSGGKILLAVGKFF